MFRRPPDAFEKARRGAAPVEADEPVAAVYRRTEDGVGAPQRSERPAQMARAKPRRWPRAPVIGLPGGAALDGVAPSGDRRCAAGSQVRDQLGRQWFSFLTAYQGINIRTSASSASRAMGVR